MRPGDARFCGGTGAGTAHCGERSDGDAGNVTKTPQSRTAGFFRCSLSPTGGSKEQRKDLTGEDPDISVTFPATPSRTLGVSLLDLGHFGGGHSLPGSPPKWPRPL